MRRFCSIFNQLLQLFPRTEFAQAVAATKAERHARGFTCWNQFVAMMFCQLARAQSLREVVGGLGSCEGKLAQLGATPPKRSTLAYANEHRPAALYQMVFEQLLGKCRDVAAPHRFQFKNKLLSADGTMIELCAEMFPWAKWRRTKGAVKLHCVLDHAGYLPSLVVITTGKQYETKVARTWTFGPGTILVVDRGYVNFHWFAQLTAAGVYFVTRMKRRMTYAVVERRRLPLNRGIEADEIITVTGRSHAVYPERLRRVVYRTPEGEVLEFLTNHLELGASTVARIYKDRWQIELFFKALKQNLRVKTFIGTSANALAIQIWTALIAFLVLKYLQLKARFGWSLSNLVALVRMNLFVYRDLWEWLDDPVTAPPPPLEPVQQSFGFGAIGTAAGVSSSGRASPAACFE